MGRQKGQQDGRTQHSKCNMAKGTDPGRKAGKIYVAPVEVKGDRVGKAETGSVP